MTTYTKNGQDENRGESSRGITKKRKKPNEIEQKVSKYKRGSYKQSKQQRIDTMIHKRINQFLTMQ